MNRRFFRFLALLLLALAVTLLWQMLPRFRPASRAGDSATTVTQVHEATASMPSPAARAIMPAASVFSKVGVPVPPRPFPRGEHSIRRYGEITTREIDPRLATRPPAVLAMLPADGRTELRPDEIDSHTLVARRMVFDPSALDLIVTGATSRVLVPTLTDQALTVEFRAIKSRSAHTHTLQGHVVGEPSTSVAQIVYHDGILHGSIMRYPNQQEIEYRILADGHLMVRELDHASMNDNCATCEGFMADIEQEAFPEVPQAAGDGPIIAYDTPGARTIDVVVGYSQEARVLDGGVPQIEARIIDSLDRMTLAFANSQIANTEMVLLGTIEDPAYVAPGTNSSNLGDELINLRNESDGVLDVVTDLGNRLGADLISFVTPAGQGGQLGVANSGNRYTISSRSSMIASQMTMEHEMGHNMGCAHAWGDSGLNTASNTGWRFKTLSGNKYSTIMAYGDGWGARVPYYSNPNVFYEGVRTGAVDGYDATGDPTVDPRLVVGGLRLTSNDYGFDGHIATLGANNAEVIDTGVGVTNYGATAASNWKVRTTFEVINPVAGSQWERGTTQTIRFNGGDEQDLAAIRLYKGGTLHSTLASGINPAYNRNFNWTIPFALADGTDYMIRVELERNGSTLTADSGVFTIFSAPPYVIAMSAPTVPENIGPVSSVVLTFNVPMDPATFSAANDIASFADPAGNSQLGLITGSSWSMSNTVLTIAFTPLNQPGTYQLVVGPGIADALGTLMDQDQDGATGESEDDRYVATFTVLPPVLYHAYMAADPGWTFSANNPATNGWAYGQPTGQGANPYRNNDPTSGFSGSNVLGYNLSGDYQTGIPDTRWATSPVFNCSGYESVILSFKRWLGLNPGDHAYIQVSNNGSSWTTIWEDPGLQQVVDDNAWVSVEYDISAVARGQATVYVRWGLGQTSSDANGGGSGWNIDDVLISGTLQDTLAVTSTDGLASTGVSGGPFSPASIQYTLQNTGARTIQWQAAKTANWISLSSGSGTLAAGASTTVTVSINGDAENYDVGSYSDVVTFTNLTTGLASTTRSVDLTILGPGTLVVESAAGLSSSGVSGTPIPASPREYTLTNGGVTAIDWVVTKTQPWVSLSSESGTLAPGASTTVTVSINSNANSLNAGDYADLVSFINTTNDSGNTTRDVLLTVYPAPASLYWDANGSTAGAGGTPSGTWGTSSFWNTNATGGSGTFSPSTTVTSNLTLVAAPASNSGNGNATVSVNGTQSANSLTSQHSGNFTISGGTSITLGYGSIGQSGITLNEFAYGTTAQGKLTVSTPVIVNTPQTWTNDKVDADYRQQTAGLDLKGGANGLTLNHALTIDGKGVTSFSSSGTTTITGTGGIVKNGTGTLILSSSTADNSTWSGGLTINGGVVRYNSPSNLGTGNINLAGGILESRSGSTSNLTTLSLGSGAGQIRVTGGVSGFSGQSSTATTYTISGAGTLSWGSTHFAPSEFVLNAATATTNGAATFTNGINLNGGTRTIRSDQTGGLAGGGVATFSGGFSGTGSLIKTGAGHVYFSAGSSYSGTTTVSEGALTLENIGSVPNYSTAGKITVAAGATLGVRTGSWAYTSIDNLRSKVNWSSTSSELGLHTGNGNYTIPSSINQALSIHKYGANTLTLTGVSTYPGTTTISQGTLQLGDGTTGKDGTIEGSSGIVNKSALIFNRFGNLSSDVDISGTGTVTKSGAGTQILNGTLTYTGTTTVSAGKLIVNGSLSDASSAFTVNSGATLGGTGTIGRNVTVAGGGKLEFDLSSPTAGHEPLVIGAGRALGFSGASVLTITSSGGAVPGIYTLVTGGNNITGSPPATVNLPDGWAATVSISGNSLRLTVSSTAAAGPVDHFTISPIASPQTAGTPVTGITITAMDASSQTATSFTGTVTFGGSAGVTGTSANFVDGVLSGVSVTPLNVGPDLTLTVNDGNGHSGQVVFTVQSLYVAWAGQGHAASFTSTLPEQNPDGDNLTNLQEFAFGTDPSVPGFHRLGYATGGDVTTPGIPDVRNFAAAGQAADHRVVFARRKDHVTAGLTYNVEFSADMAAWTTSAATPTRLTAEDSNGDVDAVSVPFPGEVPLQSGGTAAPRFVKVGVSQQ